MYSLFVGDLTPEVDDGMLYEFFYNRYPTCRGGKVVLDSMGNSKWVFNTSLHNIVKNIPPIRQKNNLT